MFFILLVLLVPYTTKGIYSRAFKGFFFQIPMICYIRATLYKYAFCHALHIVLPLVNVNGIQIYSGSRVLSAVFSFEPFFNLCP